LQVVLFLFQLDMDSQLQRALTYEHFDMAQDVRARRQQVDAALKELSQVKGPGCGARVASCSDQMEYAPQIVTVKAQMQEAAAAERYDDAAALRDRLRKLEAAAAEAAAQYLCPVEEPRFTLGEMVVHTTKGYRGVVCGWDLACCEGTEWQQAAGVRCASLPARTGRQSHLPEAAPLCCPVHAAMRFAPTWLMADDELPLCLLSLPICLLPPPSHSRLSQPACCFSPSPPVHWLPMQ
jgi:hypothetical protein